MVATRSLRRCLPTTRDRFLTPCPWVDTTVSFFTLLSLNFPYLTMLSKCIHAAHLSFYAYVLGCGLLHSAECFIFTNSVVHYSSYSHDVIMPLLWLIHHSHDPAHSLQIIHTFLIPFVLHGPICPIAY